MTQDRRITDKLPAQPLDWSDTGSTLIAAALAHLDAERIEGCFLPVPDTNPVLHVAAGPAAWIAKHAASQSQAVPSELASAAQAIYDEQRAACLTSPILSLSEMARDNEESLVSSRLLVNLFEALLSHSAATGKVPEPSRASRIECALRLIIEADDGQTLTQDLIEAGRSALALASPAAPLAGKVELASFDHSEQYRMQMAAIGSAAFGYWTEEMGIKPEYDTVPLRDVARLYAKYEAARSYSAAAGVAEPAKDTPGSMANSNARFAIDGAIMFGREGVNKPSSEDHWLYEYWNIGQQLAKLGETSGWDNVTPVYAPLAAAVPAEEASEQRKATLGDVWESGGVHWDLFPGFLIDHREGDIISEEGLQFALADMLKDADYLRVVAERAPAEPAPIQQHQCATCKDTGIVYTGPLGDPPEQCDACFDQEPAPIQASAEMLIEVADLLSERNWRGDLQEELRDLAARLSKPTSQGTAQSIDTDEFRELMCNLGYWAEEDEGDRDHCAKSLIEFIDRHIAAQAPADRDAILEEAAQLCEGQTGLNKSEMGIAKGCAAAVRWLKSPKNAAALKSQPAASHGAVEGEQNKGGEHA